VAGAASLVYEYYGRVLNPGQTPSPAMLKALLLNTPRYLNGVGSGGNLPSNSQGYGDVNLGMLFDGTARMIYDQRPADIFGATGEIRTFNGVVSNTTLPFRVTVVWTDALPDLWQRLRQQPEPGSDRRRQYLPGQRLHWRQLLHRRRATAQQRRSVFIPAGVSALHCTRVIAGNIAGDGVPGNGDTTDQDFALVIYNATLPPDLC
jgi:hypothetical protein